MLLKPTMELRSGMTNVWKVYLITNNINGKGYVGITSKPIEVRLSNHIRDAYPGRRNPNGTLYALHAAFQKYGEENFSISELQIGLTLSEARLLERHYIEKLGTYGSRRGRRGYNQTLGGEIPDEAYGQDRVTNPVSSPAQKVITPQAVSTPVIPTQSSEEASARPSKLIGLIIVILLVLYFIVR